MFSRDLDYTKPLRFQGPQSETQLTVISVLRRRCRNT